MAPHPNIRRGAQRGQSLVEFALILPLVLVLTLGIVDAARVFSSWIALNSGVGEASLYASTSVKLSHWCASAPAGSVACPAGTIAGQVDTACGLVAGDPTGNYCNNPPSDNIAYRLKVEAAGLDTSRLIMATPICLNTAGVQLLSCVDPTAPPAYVTIGASYDMDLLTPLVSNFLGHPVHMSAAATAPIISP
jgi:TadE-like protein